jgi:hypothetical protein
VNDPSASGFRPGPTLRAGAVLAAFLLLFIVIDRFSGPGEDGQPPNGSGAAAPASTSVAATTTAPPAAAAPTTTVAPTTTAAPTTTTRSQPGTTTTTTLRSADGVTVQILNGTGELRLARDFKPLVRKEGYDIKNTANTNGHYGVSTVFYTPGHKADAVAFRARFPAFRIVDAAPTSLSTTVALHIVIGENYRP